MNHDDKVGVIIDILLDIRYVWIEIEYEYCLAHNVDDDHYSTICGKEFFGVNVKNYIITPHVGALLVKDDLTEHDCPECRKLINLNPERYQSSYGK